MKKILICLLFTVQGFAISAQNFNFWNNGYIDCTNCPMDTLPHQKAFSCSHTSALYYDPALFAQQPSSNVKYVRINFVFVQKDDGTGNFNENESEHTQIFDDIITSMNSKMANLNVNSCGGTLSDTKIQFVANKIYKKNSYYWNNDNDLNFYKCPDRENWYLKNLADEIDSDPNIPLGIDIFFTVGNNAYTNNVLNCTDTTVYSGCDFACSLYPTDDINDGSYIHMPDSYAKYYWMKNSAVYQYNTPWINGVYNWYVNGMAVILIHELGHSLFLNHEYTCLNHNIMDPSGSSNSLHDYFTTNQITAMHRALSVLNVRKFVECPTNAQNDPLTISNNGLIDFGISFFRNIIVANNSTLRITCDVLMQGNSKIIVQPGSTLILDGGKLTTTCSTLWSGIEVWGNTNQHQFTINGVCNQGTCILTNGATVENAEDGVTNWKKDDYNSIGGIIQANNANFINNWRAVSFMAYYNFNPNNPPLIVNDLSRFEHCNFKTTANLLNGDPFYTFISMWKVKGIQFKGCLFENSNPNATTPNQLGSGIVTADADFTVDGYCSDPYVSPCPGAEFTKTNFTHLNYGINAGTVETNNTYAVGNSIFTNCQVGIYNTGVNNPTLTGNQFLYNSSYSPITQGTGISFIGGTGYTIEENAFTASTTGITTIGAWMQNTGGNANQIYRNTVSSYTYGFISAGQNRNSDGTVGLQFLCNTFSNGSYDIYSKIATGVLYNGCRKNQGEYISSTNIISAGNKFSSLALPKYNIRNNSSFLMNYYYGTGANEYPAVVTALVNRIASTTNNTCPCNNGGGGNRAMTTLNDLESVYFAEKEQETIYRSKLASLIDGGNTDYMVNEVENSWPDETWQLRYELLSKSPYLSEDVLSKSSDKPSVLPNPILFEIYRANPEGLNNEAIIDNLGEKPNPMSEWMIDSLRNARKKITYRTTIEGNIANHSTIKDRTCLNIIKNVLSDTNGVDHTKLQTWLANMNSFNTEIMAVNDLCQTGNYSYAETILNNMPLKFNFAPDELAEYQTFVQLFGYLKNLYQNSRTIYQLDSAELEQIKLLADDGFGLGKIYSQNICRLYGFIYDPIFDLEEEMPSLKHSYSTESQNIENINNESFLVYPSPATEWIVIKWNLLARDNNAYVKIINPDSKIQSTIQLGSLQGEQVIDVHDWPKGTYIYSVVEFGETIHSDKIVIN